jgi:hypothetical protein
MGAPKPDMAAALQPAAESLLSAFKTIDPSERRRHASVLNYWLSIRGDKEFPPLHDLDPLEISDAAPCSILLELISGGHDAEIRHLGDALKSEGKVERMIDAPSPSILASIAKKLPIVAISRDFLAFEDEYSTADGANRCWVTLLPLSAGGAWVDYVYAFVSLDTIPVDTPKAAKPSAKKAPVEEPPVEAADEALELAAEPVVDEVLELEAEPIVDEAPEREPEPVVEEVPPEPVIEEAPEEPVAEDAPPEPVVEEVAEEFTEDEPVVEEAPRPAFAKLFDKLTGGGGYYGRAVKFEADESQLSEEPVDPEFEPEPPEPVVEAELPEPIAEAEPPESVAEAEPAEAVIEAPEPPAPPVEEELVLAAVAPSPQPEKPSPALEGSLQSKLAEVRVKADEARMAKLAANSALYEGLGAAYDFALDAEDAPEQYLKLVEAQGLKIQLRSPMTPVVKLAFNGLCDDPTIAQLEAVLAWALDQNLPRGGLAERIEAAGGIARILSGDRPTE